MWEWANNNPGYFIIIVLVALWVLGDLVYLAISRLARDRRHDPGHTDESGDKSR